MGIGLGSKDLKHKNKIKILAYSAGIFFVWNNFSTIILNIFTRKSRIFFNKNKIKNIFSKKIKNKVLKIKKLSTRFLKKILRVIEL